MVSPSAALRVELYPFPLDPPLAAITRSSATARDDDIHAIGSSLGIIGVGCAQQSGRCQNRTF
jgi:hypothetical protein